MQQQHHQQQHSQPAGLAQQAAVSQPWGTAPAPNAHTSSIVGASLAQPAPSSIYVHHSAHPALHKPAQGAAAAAAAAAWGTTSLPEHAAAAAAAAISHKQPTWAAYDGSSGPTITKRDQTTNLQLHTHAAGQQHMQQALAGPSWVGQEQARGVSSKPAAISSFMAAAAAAGGKVWGSFAAADDDDDGDGWGVQQPSAVCASDDEGGFVTAL